MKKLIRKFRNIICLLPVIFSAVLAFPSETGAGVNWRLLPEFAHVIPVPTPDDGSAQILDMEPVRPLSTWEKFKHGSLIADAATKYNLDPKLIYATIMTESEGNERAYRFEPRLNEPSLGLGQILVSTARGLGFEDDPLRLYDPEISIDLIGRYYRTFLDKFPDLSTHQLVSAYNTGSPWKRSYYGHISRFNRWFYEES